MGIVLYFNDSLKSNDILLFSMDTSRQKFYLLFLKGSLHPMISTKYTELLHLKIIFRIFWNYFWNILEINVFQKKNQSLCKKMRLFLKMEDIDNSKLMGLLIIAGGGLLLNQEYNYIRKEIKKTVGASLNKKGRY